MVSKSNEVTMSIQALFLGAHSNQFLNSLQEVR